MGAKRELTGQQFGRLTVLYDSGKRYRNKVIWTCQCECGTIKDILGNDLIQGKVKSCGCYKSEKMRKNLINQRFGKLTVIEDTKKQNSHGSKIYLCQCDCGKTIEVDTNHLTTGNTQSCGCLRRNRIAKGKDITNQHFGHLTALYWTGESPNKSHIWHCQCDCGNEIDVELNYLTSYSITSCGCKRKISKGEQKIKDILETNNIPFIYQYKVKNLTLSTGGHPRFDFFINNNYFIEYDGEQHFSPIEHWGNETAFKNTQQRDLEKNQYCLKNNIPLIRIPYTYFKNIQLKDLLLETTDFQIKGDNI